MSDYPSNEIYFEIDDLMPDYLQKEAKLEELIFGLTNEAICELKSFIEENNIKNDLIFRLIIQAAKVRPFQYKVYGDFWIQIPPTKKRFYSTRFLEYLIQREIVHESQILSKMYLKQTVNEFETVFPINSFPYFIINDDVEGCSFLSTDRTIINQIIEFEGKKLLPISLAAYSSSLNVFKFLMLNGSELLTQTCACAIRGGHEEIVELLFQKGFDFSKLLHDSIFYHRNELAKWIIDEYCIEFTNVFFGLEAFNTLCIWYCIESGVSVNSEDSDHHFLINKAIENDQYEIVKYLIEKGADLISHDSLKLTIQLGQLHILQLILDNGYVLDNISPLITAIDNKQTEIAKYLISKGIPIDYENENTDTPLIKCIENEMSDIALLLIEKGANIESFNWKKDSSLLLSIEMCLPDVSISLINHGVTLNTTNLFGDTPLTKSIEKGLLDVASLLIESGANVHSNTLSGTPIVICALNGYYELIQKLIEHGANPNERDDNGKTALEIAKEHNYQTIINYLSSI